MKTPTNIPSMLCFRVFPFKIWKWQSTRLESNPNFTPALGQIWPDLIRNVPWTLCFRLAFDASGIQPEFHSCSCRIWPDLIIANYDESYFQSVLHPSISYKCQADTFQSSKLECIWNKRQCPFKTLLTILIRNSSYQKTQSRKNSLTIDRHQPG